MSSSDNSPRHLVIEKKCNRLKLRTVFLPLIILGLLGFAVNNSVISFMSSTYLLCRPKTNIVFLKTHKCAGSTLQNIFMRYGDFNNLTFVLPPKGNYLGHPEPFRKSFVIAPRLPKYNIFAHHTRFDYDEIKKFMPIDSVFITIVRNPADLFPSAYSYYRLDEFFGLNIQNFSRLSPIKNHAFIYRRYQEIFGVNQMMFDLGANPAIFHNDSLIHDYVDKLESQFHLVLVSERMDESLVFLKNLLCWDVKDVVAFKLNALSPIFKYNLTDTEKSNLLNINRADTILYNRFVSKFERQLQEFGRERMRREVLELKEQIFAWQEYCVQSVGLVSPRKHTYYANPHVMEYEPRMDIFNVTCLSLTMAELPYTERLRRKQYIKYRIRRSRKYSAKRPWRSTPLRRRF